jgi:hypothetical protein
MQITFQVMTFPWMSPANEDTIDSACQGLQNEHRINSSGAHQPNDPDVWRVLKPGNSGQIRSGVRTPVTQKGQQLGFKQL